MVHKKNYIIIFTNNMWSYILWPPVLLIGKMPYRAMRSLWKYVVEVFLKPSFSSGTAPLDLEKLGSESRPRGGAVLRVVRIISILYDSGRKYKDHLDIHVVLPASPVAS